jgi:3-hydroxy-9,10-secoandrosta-1,3,5(10)-triene-9,17-dione monooxygenase reductase component
VRRYWAHTLRTGRGANILWSLGKNSSALAAFREGPHFAVHVLAADQKETSSRFASRCADRFEGEPITRGVSNLALLDRYAARFECRLVQVHDGGDHLLFVGQVEQFHATGADPLVFHRGKYAEVAELSEATA